MLCQMSAEREDDTNMINVELVGFDRPDVHHIIAKQQIHLYNILKVTKRGQHPLHRGGRYIFTTYSRYVTGGSNHYIGAVEFGIRMLIRYISYCPYFESMHDTYYASYLK